MTTARTIATERADGAHPFDDALSAHHFPAADGVRGLAILLVLVDNSAYIERSSPALLLKLTESLTVTGWIGVQVFFVLSGFLITGILADALGKPRFFRNFYIRRTLRIFPLYYAVLILAVGVVPLVADLPAWTAKAHQNQWWYWLYMANWGDVFGHGIPGLPHFWSLAVEEQFYLAWPVLVFALSRRTMIRLCAGLMAVTPFIRLGIREAGLPPVAAYALTVARWDALAAGALLALLLRGPAGRDWLARRMGAVTVTTIAALAGVVLYEHGFHENDVLVQVIGQTLIAILAVALMHGCVTAPTGFGVRAQRAMSARWLRFLGKYSYAIYVFHFPIQKIFSYYAVDIANTGGPIERFIKLLAYLACVLGLSIGAALVSWRVLEKPCLDLKNRLAPRRQVPDSPALSEA